MPSRGRRTNFSRKPRPPPPPPPPVASSHSTSSGSSSLSPLKSARSLHTSQDDEAPTVAEGSSTTIKEDADTGTRDDDEEDEDEDEDEEEDDDGPVDGPSGVVFRYPASVPDFTELSDREKAFKIARFVRCTAEGCDCLGLEPPEGSDIILMSREEVGRDFDLDGTVSLKTEEVWWSHCGRCAHTWDDGEGHVFSEDVSETERARRGKVVGRIEELLQVGRVVYRMDIRVDNTGRGPVDHLPDT